MDSAPPPDARPLLSIPSVARTATDQAALSPPANLRVTGTPASEGPTSSPGDRDSDGGAAPFFPRVFMVPENASPAHIPLGDAAGSPSQTPAPLNTIAEEEGGGLEEGDGGGGGGGSAPSEIADASNLVFESQALASPESQQLALAVRQQEEALLRGGGASAVAPPPPARPELRSRRRIAAREEDAAVAQPAGKPASSRRPPSHRGKESTDKAIEQALEDEEYEYQGLGQDFDAKDPLDPSKLKRPWVVPTVEASEIYRMKEVFGGGRAPILGTTDADFAPLGSGVALYFRLLYSFSLLFFVLTFLSLPSVFFSAQGRRLPSTTPDPLKFAKASLGNLGPLQFDGIETKRGEVEGDFSRLWGAIFDAPPTLAAAAFNATASGVQSLAAAGVSARLADHWQERAANLSKVINAAGATCCGATSAVCNEKGLAKECGDRLVALDALALLSNWSTFSPAAWADKLDYYLSRQVYAELKVLGFPGLWPATVIPITGAMVSYIVAGCDVLIISAVLLFAVYMRNVCESFIAFVERKKVSAADFSVMVSGLPPSVSKEELRDHFSYLFALDGTGVTAQGTWQGNNVIALNEARRARREAAEAAEREAERNAAAAAAAREHARTIAYKKGGYVLGPPLSSVTVPSDTIKLRDLALAAKKATERRKKDGKVTEVDPTVDFMHRLEVVSSGPVTRPRPDPLTGALPRMPRPEYWGSWVCNVHVVKPTARFISKFRAAESIAAELREARAEVKMYSHPTPLPSGADKKKRDDAYVKVDELGEKLKEVQQAVREAERASLKATSSHDGGCIGTAFVTFHHEESMQRCLRAYEGGSMAFGLWYPAHLRFRCPGTPGFHHKDDMKAAEPDALVRWRPGFEKMASLTAQGRVVHETGSATHGAGSPVYHAYHRDAWSNFGKGYHIRVTRAPDPADVQHENLEMRLPEKCARRTATSVVTFFAVAAGLVLMTLAQYFSANLKADQPDLSACTTLVPALHFQGALNYSFAKAFAATGGVGNGAAAAFDGVGVLNRAREPPGVAAARGVRSLLRGPAGAGVGARTIPVALEAADAAAAAAAAAATAGHTHLGPAPPHRSRAAFSLGSIDSETAALATFRSAKELVYSRLPNSGMRSAEDAACGGGRASLAYRYNFSGSSALWAQFNGSVTGRAGVVETGLSDSTKAAMTGTAVAYGATKASLQASEALFTWAQKEDACRLGAKGNLARDPCSRSAQWCALKFYLSAAAAARLRGLLGVGKGASSPDAPLPPLSGDSACPDPRLLRSRVFLDSVRAALPHPSILVNVSKGGPAENFTLAELERALLPGFCPCASTAALPGAQCAALSCFPGFDGGEPCRYVSSFTLMGCYCANTLSRYNEARGLQGLVDFTDLESDACADYLSSYASTQALVVASGVSATCINLFLQFFMPLLVKTEGHSSLSEQFKAQAIKLAVAQTVITSFVAVLVNAQPPRAATPYRPDSAKAPLLGVVNNITSGQFAPGSDAYAVLKAQAVALAASTSYVTPPDASAGGDVPAWQAGLRLVGVLNGLFEDMTTPWYAKVGTTIVSTAITNALIPPLMMMNEFLRDRISQWRVRGTVGEVKTQEDMDELYVGARFNASIRYPLVLTMTIVSLLYSSSIPLILPLAALGFLLQYFVDKAMLLRFYRKPAALDASMARITIRVVPWALLAHALIAMWSFSVPNLMPTALITSDFLRESASAYLGSSASAPVEAALKWWDTIKPTLLRMDVLGIVNRATHIHTVPLFLSAVLIIVAFTFFNVLWLVGAALYGTLWTLSCGMLCCKSAVRLLRKGSAVDRLSAAAAGLVSSFRAHSARHHGDGGGGGGGSRVAPAPEPGGGAAAAASNAIFWVLGEHIAAWPAYRVFLSRSSEVVRGLLAEALFVRRVRDTPGAAAAAGLGVLALDGDTTGAGKGLGPFFCEFSRVFDTSLNGTSLSAMEVSSGWRLQEVDAVTWEDTNAPSAALGYAALRAAAKKQVAPPGAGDLELPDVYEGVGGAARAAAREAAVALEKAPKRYLGAAALARAPVPAGAAAEDAPLAYDDDAAMADLLDDAAAADEAAAFEAEVARLEAERAAKRRRRGINLLLSADGAGTGAHVLFSSPYKTRQAARKGLTSPEQARAQELWGKLRAGLRKVLAAEFRQREGLPAREGAAPAGRAPLKHSRRAVGGGGGADAADGGEQPPRARKESRDGGEQPPRARKESRERRTDSKDRLRSSSSEGGGGRLPSAPAPPLPAPPPPPPPPAAAAAATRVTVLLLRQLWTSDRISRAAGGGRKSPTANTEEGRAEEARRKALRRTGRARLTWEVIADTGIPSYSMTANPFYSHALKAAKAADAAIKEQEARKQEKDAAKRRGATPVSEGGEEEEEEEEEEGEEFEQGEGDDWDDEDGGSEDSYDTAIEEEEHQEFMDQQFSAAPVSRRI